MFCWVSLSLALVMSQAVLTGFWLLSSIKNNSPVWCSWKILSPISLVFTFLIALILVKPQPEWGRMSVVFHFFPPHYFNSGFSSFGIGKERWEKRLDTKTNAFHLYDVDVIFWLGGPSRKQGPKCWLSQREPLCVFQKLFRAFTTALPPGRDTCSAIT